MNEARGKKKKITQSHEIAATLKIYSGILECRMRATLHLQCRYGE